MDRKYPVNKQSEDYEDELLKNIANFSFIVNGLENYEPYLRAVENFRNTVQAIDDNWHLVTDKSKLDELRVTKLAALELVNYVPFLKEDLKKAQEELAKIKNPDLIINKDYDQE